MEPQKLRTTMLTANAGQNTAATASAVPIDTLVQLRAKIDSLIEAIYLLETQINDGGDQAFHPWYRIYFHCQFCMDEIDKVGVKRPELLSKYLTILSFTHSLSASLVPPPVPPAPKNDELQRERDRREHERAWTRTTANVVVHPAKPAEMEQAGRLLNMLVTKPVCVCITNIDPWSSLLLII
jgi:hypothetical protein